MSTNATALSSIDFSSIFQGILAVLRPFTAPRVVADNGSGGKACPEMDPIPGYEKVALTDGEGMMWHCFIPIDTKEWGKRLENSWQI